MKPGIGIIGCGMVGNAVKAGFPLCDHFISDPAINDVTVEDVCKANPAVIFVCVPTPSDGTDYSILRSVLDKIIESLYAGLVVVKSTVLPHVLEKYDVLYNPEFLSRETAVSDFLNPHYLIIGGKKSYELLEFYSKYSVVDVTNAFMTDIPTASFIKYTMNTFFALKVTFMNEMKEVANSIGADYDAATKILSQHPWMGSNHFKVPGPDGFPGFGGPCLPKDTEALAEKFDVKLLKLALELNSKFRP